jgi:hypothetical protein
LMISKVLVSCCNKGESVNFFDAGIFVYSVCLKTGHVEAIDIGLTEQDHGCAGVAPYGGGWVVAVQNNLKRALKDEPVRLVELDRNLGVVACHELPGVNDPHSLVTIGSRVFITSSGNDSVFLFDENREVSRYWQGSKGDEDDLHINSIASLEGDLLISAFGPRESAMKDSARSGYVQSIGDGAQKLTTLYHPHSVQVCGDDIWVCESGTGKVWRNSEPVVSLAEGYVRGLAVTDRQLVVGVSRQRLRSRSGEGSYEPKPEKIGESSLLVYAHEQGSNLKLEASIALEKYTDEIYDIAVLN